MATWTFFRLTVSAAAACLAGVFLAWTVPPVHAADGDKAASDWHYGAFLDLSYANDFNYPENHLFRDKSTTRRVNQLAPNMAYGYVRKDRSTGSPGGVEVGLQTGLDTKEFAISESSPHLAGSDTLRHFGRANVSYRMPVGQGLTVTAGLFNSLIGEESLYARENFHYTRAWIADSSPYAMFGVSAAYPVGREVDLTLYVINSYYHLDHANDQPSYGAQVAWKPTSRLTIKETVYYGPDQANTALEFWRFFTDTIVQWQGEQVALTFTYDFGTENLAVPGSPRTFWTGSAFSARWHISGPWSAAIRPEFYWDRNGRLTGNEQLIRAITTTLEYKARLGRHTPLFRLEYRYDESTGPQGGFFKGGTLAQTGQPALTPGQQLLLMSVIWSFDS